MCDKADYIKLICYEESFFSKFSDGATVIVRNFITGTTSLFMKLNDTKRLLSTLEKTAEN